MAARKKIDKAFRIRLHPVRDHMTGKIINDGEVLIIYGHTAICSESTEDNPSSFRLLRADGTAAYLNPDAFQVRDCVALDAVQKMTESSTTKIFKIIQ